MKVLVTGGAGFIGQNLVKRLTGQDDEVIILDDLSANNPTRGGGDTPQSGHKILVQGNVADRGLVDTLVKQVGLIFHLAVRTMALSTHRPEDDMITSVGGTLNILRAAQKYGVPVVYTSSSAVYGNGLPPFREDSLIDLLTPYAAGKYAAEGYCQAFRDVPVSIVRLTNVYGPHQYAQNPYCGVIARFMEQAAQKTPLTIYGSGEQTRDFTYVEDVIDALLLAREGVGQIFNIGTGVETSIWQLARKVGQLFGFEEMTFSASRDIDLILRRGLDCRKAKHVLGWQAQTDLADGLKLTQEWLKISNCN